MSISLRNTKENKCFVVYYGKEFNLKSWSIVALSEAECDTWYRGLMYLIEVSDLVK